MSTEMNTALNGLNATIINFCWTPATCYTILNSNFSRSPFHRHSQAAAVIRNLQVKAISMRLKEIEQRRPVSVRLLVL
jgi:hypothetical protein